MGTLARCSGHGEGGGFPSLRWLGGFDVLFNLLVGKLKMKGLGNVGANIQFKESVS